MQNIFESHGENNSNDWDTPAAAAITAEPVVTLAQGAEEVGRDVKVGLKQYLEPLIPFLFVFVEKTQLYSAFFFKFR